jgi:hypothetical protein
LRFSKRALHYKACINALHCCGFARGSTGRVAGIGRLGRPKRFPFGITKECTSGGYACGRTKGLSARPLETFGVYTHLGITKECTSGGYACGRTKGLSARLLETFGVYTHLGITKECTSGGYACGRTKGLSARPLETFGVYTHLEAQYSLTGALLHLNNEEYFPSPCNQAGGKRQRWHDGWTGLSAGHTACANHRFV